MMQFQVMFVETYPALIPFYLISFILDDKNRFILSKEHSAGALYFAL
jgi:transketolase N-terminal domain/subunit